MHPQINADKRRWKIKCKGGAPVPARHVYISTNANAWNGIYTHEASENAIDISQDSELFNR